MFLFCVALSDFSCSNELVFNERTKQEAAGENKNKNSNIFPFQTQLCQLQSLNKLEIEEKLT